MSIIFCQRLSLKTTICVLILSIIIISYGCSNPSADASPKPKRSAPSGGCSSACIDLKGSVLGDLLPNSTVSLHEISNVDSSIVMHEIRTGRPSQWTLVNESKEFQFHCLSYGKYAFVIPMSSYNGFVGLPLPYESDCRNFSLNVAFQGGDSQYAVGVFSIENYSALKYLLCRKSRLSAWLHRAVFTKNHPSFCGRRASS
jgi:hypothetical protein